MIKLQMPPVFYRINKRNIGEARFVTNIHATNYQSDRFCKKGEEIPDMLENVGAKVEPTAKQVMKHFGQAKDYFVDEIIPTAKKVGKAIGPGIAER